MSYIVLVSIDDTESWGRWHSLRSNTTYYSDFLTQEQVDGFIETLRRKFPDSNLNTKFKYKYHIEYCVVNADTFENDTDNFKNFLFISDLLYSWGDYLRTENKDTKGEP